METHLIDEIERESLGRLTDGGEDSIMEEGEGREILSMFQGSDADYVNGILAERGTVKVD